MYVWGTGPDSESPSPSRHFPPSAPLFLLSLFLFLSSIVRPRGYAFTSAGCGVLDTGGALLAEQKPPEKGEGGDVAAVVSLFLSFFSFSFSFSPFSLSFSLFHSLSLSELSYSLHRSLSLSLSLPLSLCFPPFRVSSSLWKRYSSLFLPLPRFACSLYFSRCALRRLFSLLRRSAISPLQTAAEGRAKRRGRERRARDGRDCGKVVFLSPSIPPLSPLSFRLSQRRPLPAYLSRPLPTALWPLLKDAVDRGLVFTARTNLVDCRNSPSLSCFLFLPARLPRLLPVFPYLDLCQPLCGLC